MQYISEPVGGPKVTRIGWRGISADSTPEKGAHTFGGLTSVQIGGVLGGAIVHIEGSNDGESYSLLSDPQSNALTFNAPDIKRISEQVSHIRPVVAGGGVDTGVDVTLLVRRPV